MAYTLPSAADVIGLTGTKLGETLVERIITSAEQVFLQCADNYTDEQATEILLWLSSHMVAATGPTNGSLTGRSLMDSSKSWAKASLGEGLKGSTYGQMVISLDKCGCIGRIGKGVASIKVVL